MPLKSPRRAQSAPNRGARSATSRSPQPARRAPLERRQSAQVRASVRARSQDATRLVAARGADLTPIRRQVLELVAGQKRAVTAYEILDALARDGGGPVHPPTVYRALEFLLAHGLVHRIEALAAYVACDHPGEAHASRLLVCRDCGRVDEIDSDEASGMVDRVAKRHGFAADTIALELQGVCDTCVNAPGAAR